METSFWQYMICCKARYPCGSWATFQHWSGKQTSVKR